MSSGGVLSSHFSGPLQTNNSSNTSSNNSSDLVNMSSSGSHISTKLRRMSTIESSSPPSTSRTPEVLYSSNSSSGFSGLKFGYESQTPASSNTATQLQPSMIITQPTIKDSPPSSPSSEIGTKKPTKKQKTGTNTSAISPIESKENKLFQNGVSHAAHMLGNQLNPNSSMAPKLAESLSSEIEAHIQNSASVLDPSTHIGPTYPGKIQAVMP